MEPRFYALDRVSYGVRSDGAPVVLIDADDDARSASRLPDASVGSTSTASALVGWSLLANVTMAVLDGPDVGFLLAAPAFARTQSSTAVGSRWLASFDANGGAIAVLVDGVHLGFDDNFDAVQGVGGFVTATYAQTA